MTINITKLEEWTQIFARYLRGRTIELHVKEDEGYKFQSVQNFQTCFDIDAPDLAGNLEQAIENNNLVAGAMYFPRKMLLIYAQKYPEQTRDALRHLFDESLDISERITATKLRFEELEKERAIELKQRPVNTYIGLRFISLLLGYRYPDKYNPLKPAEWRVFARFLNPDFSIPNYTPAGEQYKIYCEYIDELREFLKRRPDFMHLKEKLTDGHEFQDPEARWLAQDIIFVTARVFAGSRAQELAGQQETANTSDDAEPDSDSDQDDFNTGFMPLEKHLEEYVIKNWENINFGEDIRIYLEDDGTTGQQYPTDVGIIDILALDEHDNFVVIELKRAEYGYKVVGQILNYMGWVKKHLATDDQEVRGMVIVGKADKTLRSALEPISDKVSLREYKIKMYLQAPDNT